MFLRSRKELSGSECPLSTLCGLVPLHFSREVQQNRSQDIKGLFWCTNRMQDCSMKCGYAMRDDEDAQSGIALAMKHQRLEDSAPGRRGGG